MSGGADPAPAPGPAEEPPLLGHVADPYSPKKGRAAVLSPSQASPRPLLPGGITGHLLNQRRARTAGLGKLSWEG